MEILSQENLYAIGTIRNDGIEKAPLQDLKKSDRGSFCSVTESKSEITLV